MLPSRSSGLEPDEVGQKGQNYSTYDITHKNSKSKFFHLEFKDVPSLLRAWMAL